VDVSQRVERGGGEVYSEWCQLNPRTRTRTYRGTTRSPRRSEAIRASFQLNVRRHQGTLVLRYAPLDAEAPPTSVGQARESGAGRGEVVAWSQLLSSVEHSSAQLVRSSSCMLLFCSTNMATTPPEHPTTLTLRLAKRQELVRDHPSNIMPARILLLAPAVSVAVESRRVGRVPRA
jgi:hypothetical protein